jgi:hypothetical protein
VFVFDRLFLVAAALCFVAALSRADAAALARVDLNARRQARRQAPPELLPWRRANVRC